MAVGEHCMLSCHSTHSDSRATMGGRRLREVAVGEQGRRDEARAPYPGKGRAPLAAGLPHAARMLARAVWHASLADRGPPLGGGGGVGRRKSYGGLWSSASRGEDEHTREGPGRRSANIQGSIRSRKVKLLFSYESVTASW